MYSFRGPPHTPLRAPSSGPLFDPQWAGDEVCDVAVVKAYRYVLDIKTHFQISIACSPEAGACGTGVRGWLLCSSEPQPARKPDRTVKAGLALRFRPFPCRSHRLG